MIGKPWQRQFTGVTLCLAHSVVAEAIRSYRAAIFFAPSRLRVRQKFDDDQCVQN
jgi:hypothetical protein